MVLACCALTGILTRKVVRDAVQADPGQAGDLDGHREAFEEFLGGHTPADGERLTGDALPPALRRAGVSAVYRWGQAVRRVTPLARLGSQLTAVVFSPKG